MRTILTVLTLAILAGSVVAQQRTNGTELIEVKWLEYKSTEGRYRAEFPAEPKLETQEAKSANGSPFRQYFALTTDDSGLFMVAYFDYAAPEVFSLEKGRDGMVNAVDGTLINDRIIDFNGAPGREFKIESKLQNGKPALSMLRIYDVSGRVYILQHMYYKDADPALANAHTQKFFKSFAVIPNR